MAMGTKTLLIVLAPIFSVSLWYFALFEIFNVHMKVSNIYVINVTIKQKGRIIWQFISSWTVSGSQNLRK